MLGDTVAVAATLGPRGLTDALVAYGQEKGASKNGASARKETDDIEMILRIRRSNPL